ncbi:tRNA (adenosine(37)-N6)-threonylcarbamoyltransferase complex dimerization subunit type 1 TsaB [Rhizobium sp. FKL33]|uniref:tRNA (adenosine(37)-N6)-threonylcarbamoyltransferase complex dimerization subunit type 1 TsaB n=1 Tax=Rhizobium sp. FKL33 TaxID=2562307 RepID=UPI0010BF7675|nr:tRNA (adenosine(37)-N6)-threonylcarbamoyltransferase complex dimerization subunit type 1 TsaB [Rhizobium sp. FKL33]
MRLLLIDTSGPVCAAAIYDAEAGSLLSQRSEMIGKGHAELLPVMVDEIVAESGVPLADLDRVAVTVGPGSFTGIRVGVAMARGFGVALGKPVVGVSTLRIVAESVLEIGPPAPVMAVLDAKREEVYGQVFSPAGEALTDPVAYDYAGAQAAASRFQAITVGSGAGLLTGGDADGADAFPLAVIGRIASRADEDEQASPLYIRGADAKPQTGFAVQHA